MERLRPATRVLQTPCSQAEASEKQKALEERDMAVFQEAGCCCMDHATIGTHIVCVCISLYGYM